MADSYDPAPDRPSEKGREGRSDPDFPAIPEVDSDDENLSEINTFWPLVDQAKVRGPGSREAQEWLLGRYKRAIIRYLTASLRDEDAVDEVYQEYARLLVSGSFANVEPARGKFRRYLKRTLSNLVNDHYRRRKKLHHLPIDSGSGEPLARPEPPPFDDEQFTSAWRHDLIVRAWDRLRQHERMTGKPVATLLKYRIANRGCRSYEMAETFADLLGPSATDNKVRKLLCQARKLFAETLLEGVAESISEPSPQALEEELIELDLMKYCGEPFAEWKRRRGLEGPA
jgi:RNA polymerase sigma-70 factor (ECF subfamily)